MKGDGQWPVSSLDNSLTFLVSNFPSFTMYVTQPLYSLCQKEACKGKHTCIKIKVTETITCKVLLATKKKCPLNPVFSLETISFFLLHLLYALYVLQQLLSAALRSCFAKGLRPPGSGRNLGGLPFPIWALDVLHLNP